jgi:coenzyme F420-0:L-glutamate ligase/coenzyme F420-1:gamma-L-glutamate ligase
VITVWAPAGVGEVRAGDDVAATLLEALHRTALADGDRLLRDGDVVVVTSKVVSKAEGRARVSTREAELPGQTARVVARRGPTTIVRNLLGLTMAAAGIDASNVAAGTVLLLPEDPDASARRIRTVLRERTGVNVGVVITDTAGRAWRDGQTDVAIGAAGLTVLQSFAGQADAHGNPLAVTAPAVADEIASAAELAQGKLGNRPFAVVRGRSDLVLPVGEEGPGAASLVRPEGADLFGYGAREAVLRALAGDPADLTPFGAPATAEEVATAVSLVLGRPAEPVPGGLAVPADPRVAPLAFAHGWAVDHGMVEASEEGAEKAVIRPVTP